MGYNRGMTPDAPTSADAASSARATPDQTSLPRLRRGDRVAVVSPSFAAPGFAPEIHEQAMRRLAELTGLVPVEYPTTRQLGASPQDRARDLNAAFGDPDIRAVLATIGGDDQITVTPHLDPSLPVADPKPFLGYSDNTHLLNWLWQLGVPGYYGGSTQVHLGPGPSVDEVHLRSLTAALLEGGRLEITDPEESEDFGVDWLDPDALTRFGQREPTQPWVWAGPARAVEGPSWGGCLDLMDQLALADRLPPLEHLEGAVLLLETSEEVPSATQVRRLVRGLGERGLLGVVAGVLVARPPTSSHGDRPAEAERARLRREQRETVVELVSAYAPDAVVCVGVPFGHTRPQWILPYGGRITLDGATQTVHAQY